MGKFKVGDKVIWKTKDQEDSGAWVIVGISPQQYRSGEGDDIKTESIYTIEKNDRQTQVIESFLKKLRVGDSI